MAPNEYHCRVHRNGPNSSSVAALVQAAASVVRQADLRSVLLETIGTAMKLTGAKYGALGVIGDHGTLVEFHHLGLKPNEAANIGPLPTGGGVLGTLIHRAETVRIPEISEHTDSLGFPEHHPEMHTFLGVPVRMGEQVFGNLYLTEKAEEFTLEDQTIVEALAVVAGSAISSERLHARLRSVAVVEDRERIARDLHDAIIQDMFAVGLSLQGLGMRVEDSQTTAALEDAVVRLDEAITSLRQFIFGLRPSIWSDRSLHSELADDLNQLSSAYSTNLKLHLRDVGHIDSDLVDHLLAMVRELASNALRHARPTELIVSLDRFGEEIEIIVEDDGVGFDTAKLSNGMGRRNLEERASQIDAKYIVVSEPGGGARASVRVSI